MVVLSELLVLPEDEDVRWDALASYNILDTVRRRGLARPGRGASARARVALAALRLRRTPLRACCASWTKPDASV